MTARRSSIAEFKKRRTREGWTLVAEYANFQGLDNFKRYTGNQAHIRFGPYAMKQVEKFYPEVEREAGPAASNQGPIAIFLDEGESQFFLSVVRQPEDYVLTWSCRKQDPDQPVAPVLVMYADKQAFVDEVKREYATIKGRNIWAKKYFEHELPGGSLAEHAEISAERCWSLYCASRDNTLGFLLLGEVSMRSKMDLVQNFGLSSAFGHEDDEPWLGPWLGSEITDPVTAQDYLSGVDPTTLDPKRNAHLTGLQGPGSILSDRLWTPLMNDVWLLGGIHRHQEFHLVTDGLGQDKLVAAMNALLAREVPQAGEVRPADVLATDEISLRGAVKDVWRSWFNDNPNYLYETWGPRVLARELLGLMTFGYQPAFMRQELGFRCADAKCAAQATIGAYSESLYQLGFHKGNDPAARSTVLQALSAWLFGQGDALKS